MRPRSHPGRPAPPPSLSGLRPPVPAKNGDQSRGRTEKSRPLLGSYSAAWAMAGLPGRGHGPAKRRFVVLNEGLWSGPKVCGPEAVGGRREGRFVVPKRLASIPKRLAGVRKRLAGIRKRLASIREPEFVVRKRLAGVRKGLAGVGTEGAAGGAHIKARR